MCQSNFPKIEGMNSKYCHYRPYQLGLKGLQNNVKIVFIVNNLSTFRVTVSSIMLITLITLDTRQFPGSKTSTFQTQEISIFHLPSASMHTLEKSIDQYYLQRTSSFDTWYTSVLKKAAVGLFDKIQIHSFSKSTSSGFFV